MNIPHIIGHRGCSLAPENTMAAFREAYRGGAQAVELDIHCSKDGQLVVCHDDRVDRTTDGHGEISQMDWAELKSLDAGSWYGPAFAGERLPLLAEVLEWARDKVQVFIEIKEGPRPPDFDDRLLTLLQEKGMESQVHIISFDHEEVRRLKQRQPGLDMGLLYSERGVVEQARSGFIGGAVAGAALGAAGAGLLGALAGAVGGAAIGAAAGLFAGRRAQAREWQEEKGKVDMVLPFWLSVDRWGLGAAHHDGLKVVPYTADAPRLVRGLQHLGCEGVLTNRPDLYPDHA